MSLQKAYRIQLSNFDDTLVVKNAVWRIDNVIGNKTCMSLNVSVYKDETVEQIIGRQSFDFTPSVELTAKNIFAQGYEHLKTLSEFENALDC
jgi:hypothetical protein